MLKQLTVKNVALVSVLDIHFDRGLTVITGESGAGKSILLGALGLVLGERASVDIIRPGTERADVSAEFDLTSAPANLEFLDVQELIDTDAPQRCLVRRVVSTDGRSRAFINGTPVTLGVLRDAIEGLVDIHGQDQNQRLGNRRVQLQLLDDFGVKRADYERMTRAYVSWQDAHQQALALEEALSSAEDRRSLLTYQMQELDDLALADGEFEALEVSMKRLSNIQMITETVEGVFASLDSMDRVRQAPGQLEHLPDDHPDLVSAREALTSAVALAEDAQRDLRHYLETLDLDPGELNRIETQIDLIHDLARKHKVRPETLVQYHETLRQELDSLSGEEGNLTDLKARADSERQTFKKFAKKVSTARRKSAKGFCKEVSACMNTLGIKGGSLAIEFHDRESENGLEDVEYLITTNPKYPPAPLNRIASGGERARISLAIQVIAAQRSALPCLVLDEADVGVGGTAADIIGRMLKDLGAHTQVLCVTHAPQVAALGEQHLQVSKDDDQETRIAALDALARIDEVARMLAGANITRKTRDYAQTLLSEASSTPSATTTV
jgi:DNA repair protein RecN (Recombination protein N)